MTRRWYWIAGCILMAAPFPTAGVLAVLQAIWPQVVTMSEDRWLNWFILLVTLPPAAGVAWTCWLCPWLASGDTAMKPPEHPMAYSRSLRGFLWLPAGFCLMSAAVFVFIRVTDQAPLPPKAFLMLGLSVLSFILLLPWTLWLSRGVKRRLRVTLTARAICWRCGYDLRGNPDATACPECGEEEAYEADGVETGGIGP